MVVGVVVDVDEVGAAVVVVVVVVVADVVVAAVVDADSVVPLHAAAKTPMITSNAIRLTRSERYLDRGSFRSIPLTSAS